VNRVADTAVIDAPPFDPALVACGHDAMDVWLIGWRCDQCGHLALGERRVCGLCGGRDGQRRRLGAEGELDTWTTVVRRERTYVVGYCYLGDGEDDRRVRVFGPVLVDTEDQLRRHARIRIDFVTSTLRGKKCVHHAIVPLTASEE